MIAFDKDGTYSFVLKTDIQGIRKILMYIDTVLEKSEESIPIRYSGKEKNFSIKLDPDMDEMFIREDFIEMYMDEE